MEGEDGMLMIHNKDGNDIQEVLQTNQFFNDFLTEFWNYFKQTIWQYFGCTASDDSPKDQMISKLGFKRSSACHQMRAQQEEDNNRYAALIITGMIVSIIISNTSAAVFWLYVNKKSKKEMENI